MANRKPRKSNPTAGKRSPPDVERAPSSPANDAARPSIAALRSELDAIDRGILAAINRRGEIARQIGHVKNANKSQVYDPARESHVLEQAIAVNTGPLPDDPAGVERNS